jgi:AcrR family transcriptional regulator
MAAETLYREGRLSVNAIADKLHISKSTLYSYLRHRGVEIGAYQKEATNTLRNQPAEQVAEITLRLNIENNSQSVRGKKRARENIERYCLNQYPATGLSSGDHTLRVNYKTREDLDALMTDLLRDMSDEAEMRHCYIEGEA